MTTRPVDLFDLPLLIKNRSSYIGLDSAKQLAHGTPLNFSGLVSRAIPINNLYTVIDSSAEPILGSIEHSPEKPSAKLSFLSSHSGHYDDRFIPLIEEMCAVAGKNGAFHIVAETVDNSQVLNLLRRTGFAVYSTQKICQVEPSSVEPASCKWAKLDDAQRLDAKNLYEQITPPMIQAIEPFNVCPGRLLACNGSRVFAWIDEGKAGTVIIPLVHPDEKNLATLFSDLIIDLKASGTPKIFFIIRSTMSWFEPIVTDLGGVEIRTERILVKHLVNFVLEKETVKNAKAQRVTILSSHIKRND